MLLFENFSHQSLQVLVIRRNDDVLNLPRNF
jgi:hypothetical protein